MHTSLHSGDIKQSIGWVTITEHVAQWIGRWTQDQKVWGSIPSAWPFVEVLGNTSYVHIASVHPAIEMGTWCTDPRLDQ